MPQLYCVLDLSGSMSEWRKKESCLALVNALLFASKNSWPFFPAIFDAVSLYTWQGDGVKAWAKGLEAEFSAGTESLRKWLEELAATGCAYILLLSDGNLISRECVALGQWLREKTELKLEAICAGPDGDRANLALISSSGHCFEIDEVIAALASLACLPPVHEGDMTEWLAEIRSRESSGDED